MKIRVPIPQRAQELLASLAFSRSEARQEVEQQGVPTPCRLLQLSIVGALARLGWQVDSAIRRFSDKVWKMAIVIVALCVASLIAIFVSEFVLEGLVEGLIFSGWIAALFTILLISAFVLLGLFTLAGWILVRLARFCPIQVPGLDGVVLSAVEDGQ